MGVTHKGDDKKGFHWANQSLLLIEKSERIMKELLPCPIEKLIAEIKYRTGLSEKKTSELVNMFVNREVVIFKEMDYRDQKVICMVFVDGKGNTKK